MRVVRVLYDGDVRYGLADDGTITLISDEPFAAWETEDVVALADAKLISPVIPTKIVCVGLNYHAHAEELGMTRPKEPVLFLKPPTAMNGPNGDVHVPESETEIDYEAVLAVVIGRRARALKPRDATQVILGYTCANDVTARRLQKVDGQWTRAKGFDGFCPLGPWVETDVDPADLKIETYLNGELKQSSSTADMIFDPAELVSFCSQVMTLLPGDVVLTGTPQGVGPMSRGDVIEVRIQDVGSLVNRIV